MKEIKADFLGLESYWMDCERRSKDIWIDQMQIWERRADSIKLINIQEQQSYIFTAVKRAAQGTTTESRFLFHIVKVKFCQTPSLLRINLVAVSTLFSGCKVKCCFSSLSSLVVKVQRNKNKDSDDFIIAIGSHFYESSPKVHWVKQI